MSVVSAVGAQALHTGPVGDPVRYRVDPEDLTRVETGGEGLVYRAFDTGTGRPVALKLLTALPLAAFGRFSERASLLAGLSHPNLMGHVDVFLGTPLRAVGAPAPDDEFDVPYTVAEWVDGVPLTVAVAGASADTKLTWVAELAGALSCMHGFRSDATPHGIVHRDVKPSNVRVRRDGTAVLLDYGVARPVHLTDMTEGVGTYLWRAPEVLAGATATPGVETDAWGLGALAHWLLTGGPPLLDGPELARQRMQAAARRAGVGDPDAVAKHLSELLHLSAADRPSDLGRWAKSLRALLRRRHARRRIAALVSESAAAVLALALIASSSGFAASPAAARAPQWAPEGDYPYLTFGHPTVEVVRRSVQLRSPTNWTFIDTQDRSHSLQFDIERHPAVDVLQSFGVTPAGAIGHHQVSIRQYGLSATGRTYQFGDGDWLWVVSTEASGMADVSADALAKASRRFIAGLDTSGPIPRPYRTYREIPVLDVSVPLWALSSQNMTITSYRNSSLAIADLPGERLQVRGDRDAVAGRHGLTWRETPNMVVNLTLGDEGAGRITNPAGWLATRRALADDLVTSTKAEYLRRPSDLGASDGSIVATSDRLTSGMWLGYMWIYPSFEHGTSPQANPFGTGGGVLVPDKDAIAVFVWTIHEPDPLTGVTPKLPTCAKRYDVPPKDSPPVIIKLDPECVIEAS